MIENNSRNFGDVDPLSVGISAGRSVVSYVATPIVAATYGISTLAASTIIGIPLAIASFVFSLFRSRRAKKSAKRKAKRAYVAALINAVRKFMAEKIGYREDLLNFGYEFAHPFFDIWSRYMQNQSEENRKAIVDLLRSYGFDPTRFVGGDNVRQDEKLDPKQANNAEKHLSIREFLVDIGYPESIIEFVSERFGIGVYDGILAFGEVRTQDEAVRVKVQLEDFFIDEGINPLHLYKVAIYGEAYYPYADIQDAQNAQTALAPSVSLAAIPTMGWVLLAGLAGGALSLLTSEG